MIKNERQYRVTNSQVARFRHALAQLDLEPEAAEDAIRRAHRDAVAGELSQLEAQVAEYESLRDASEKSLRINSLSQLPEILVKARIALGWSQKDLADRLLVAEQQVQRYEATDYAAASLRRLLQIADAMGIEIDGEAALRPPRVTLKELMNRISSAGLDREFAIRRLLPRHLSARLVENDKESEGTVLTTLAGSLQRVFGWSSADLFGTTELRLPSAPLATASLKVPTSASDRAVVAYSAYGQFLASLVVTATPNVISPRVPRQWQEVVAALDTQGPGSAFGQVLRYAWSMDVAIVPLEGTGGFHAATWRIAGRDVVVMKQSSRSEARWAFDLLHELRHCAELEQDQGLTSVEVEGKVARDPAFEWECNLFAGNVLLRGQAEAMAEAAVKAAGGKVERLKGALPAVARQFDVAVDVAANYLAFRLSRQGINWWGTATNFQPVGDPWALARDILFERLDARDLLDVDRTLLTLAMSRDGESQWQ